MFLIDFHVLALPAFSRAHNDVRLQNQYRQPRFRVQLCEYGQMFFTGKETMFAQTCLGINQRNQTSSHALFLTQYFLREFPPAPVLALTLALTLVLGTSTCTSNSASASTSTRN
jgi:hypothetical protein